MSSVTRLIQMSIMGRLYDGDPKNPAGLYRILNRGHELSIRRLVVGAERGKPGYDFTHPGVDTIDTVFEFKHSDNSGAKWWTKSPGRNFVFNIPADDIFVNVGEYWMSYIRAKINGADVIFDVDGSSFRDNGRYGSVDIIGDYEISLGVNPGLLVFERLAEFHVELPADYPPYNPKNAVERMLAPLGFGDR